MMIRKLPKGENTAPYREFLFIRRILYESQQKFKRKIHFFISVGLAVFCLCFFTVSCKTIPQAENKMPLLQNGIYEYSYVRIFTGNSGDESIYRTRQTYSSECAVIVSGFEFYDSVLKYTFMISEDEKVTCLENETLSVHLGMLIRFCHPEPAAFFSDFHLL